MTPQSTVDPPLWYCRGRFFVLRCRTVVGLLVFRAMRASVHQQRRERRRPWKQRRILSDRRFTASCNASSHRGCGSRMSDAKDAEPSTSTTSVGESSHCVHRLPATEVHSPQWHCEFPNQGLAQQLRRGLRRTMTPNASRAPQRALCYRQRRGPQAQTCAARSWGGVGGSGWGGGVQARPPSRTHLSVQMRRARASGARERP